jgi:hypothetical protein
MKTEVAYCSGCGHKVRLVFTDPPPHGGHANLPDGAEIVCLDYQEGCAGGKCPMTDRAGVVMGVRLARSHLADERFETVHARCDACGMTSDLEVIDDSYALCTLCETTNTWVRMKLADDTEVVLTGR